MSEPFRDPYSDSYPPSLWGGGGGQPVSAWGTSAGDISALFTTETGVDPSTIADRPTLLADAQVGTAAMTAQYDHDEFPPGAYIMLGDGDWVSWGGAGAGWVDGPTPPPPPPEPLPDETWTAAQIVAWLVGRGVTITDAAAAQLTVAELLSLVADLLDDDDPATAQQHLDEMLDEGGDE